MDADITVSSSGEPEPRPGSDREGVAKVATVRASCPTCGDVELTTREVQVQVCSATDEGTYSFLCPSCRLIVNKPAEQRVVELLVSAGVKVVNWDLPAELSECKMAPRSVTTTCSLSISSWTRRVGWSMSSPAADRWAPAKAPR